MKNSKSTSNTAPAMEDILTDLFHKGEEFLRPRWETVEDQIRQSPTKAVLIAAGIGYCLHRMPAGSLLSSALKVVWAVAPPAAVAALAGKGFNLLEDKLHITEETPKSRGRKGAAQASS